MWFVAPALFNLSITFGTPHRAPLHWGGSDPQIPLYTGGGRRPPRLPLKSLREVTSHDISISKQIWLLTTDFLNRCWHFEIQCFFMTGLKSRFQKLSLTETHETWACFSHSCYRKGLKRLRFRLFEKSRFSTPFLRSYFGETLKPS